jgi:hypothetical protein
MQVWAVCIFGKDPNDNSVNTWIPIADSVYESELDAFRELNCQIMERPGYGPRYAVLSITVEPASVTREAAIAGTEAIREELADGNGTST